MGGTVSVLEYACCRSPVRTRATLRSPAGIVSLTLLYFSFTNIVYAVPGRLGAFGALAAFTAFASSWQ